MPEWISYSHLFLSRGLFHTGIAALFLCLVQAASAQRVTVNLRWNPNQEPDIVGYRLLYGTATGTYTQAIDVGNATMATVSNLTGGTAYFFAATAYNETGIESMPSNEVVFTPFGPPPTPGPTLTPAPTPGPAPSPSPTPGPTPTPGLEPAPTPTPSSTPIPAPTRAPGPASLVNISTRAFTQTGDNVTIGGFIIAGDVPKNVLLRAIGPSLTTSDVSRAMANPALRLYDSAGVVIASNDDWRSDQGQIIEASGLAPEDDREAALVTTLPPGAYTVALNDETNNSGVALFELYDLAPASSQLTNLSTRGKVETDDRVMIAGFIISGDQPSEIIVRALGPSVAQHGIPDALIDPTLELHNEDGSLVIENDNWRSDQEQQILDSALAPLDDRESAIMATLNPGAYTVIVRGAGNSTGTALFEIYKLAR